MAHTKCTCGKPKVAPQFGDFCFSNSPSSLPLSCWSCDDPQRPISNISCAPIVEAPEFKSLSVDPSDSGGISNKFLRFLDLSEDVRNIIYDFCVEPLRDQKGVLKLEIAPAFGRRCHPERDNYSIISPIAVKIDTLTHAKSQNWHLTHDPARGKSSVYYHRHIRRQDYDRIRHLSNVNHQIRAELGKMFWKNVYIDTDYWHPKLFTFLAQRPSTHLGIKSLRFLLFDPEMQADDRLRSEDLQYLSTHLVLDEMTLCLKMSTSSVKSLIASENNRSWVRAFRAISIKNLMIKLMLTDGIADLQEWLEEESDNDSDESDEGDASDENDEIGTSSDGENEPDELFTTDRYQYWVGDQRARSELEPALAAFLNPPVPAVGEQEQYFWNHAQARSAGLLKDLKDY